MATRRDERARVRGVRDAIIAGSSPDAIGTIDTRLQRTGVRIALRQLACQAETAESRALIQDWRAHYDASSVEEDPLERVASDWIHMTRSKLLF